MRPLWTKRSLGYPLFSGDGSGDPSHGGRHEEARRAMRAAVTGPKPCRFALAIAMGLCLPLLAGGQVRLPRLISDGMVLQRDSQTRIWGWAAGGENVTVRFRGEVYRATADGTGAWAVTLKGLDPGGPDSMEIEASNRIVLHDVVAGDVWVCSGQSNMELPVSRVSPKYPAEIASSENPNIRQFAVPQRYDFKGPHEDLESGGWVPANPESVLRFSAAAYFFARELYAKYHVPIGLINASLGGAPAESFISEGALRAFPQYYAEAQRFKDSLSIARIETQDRVRIDAWYAKLREQDAGFADTAQRWDATSVDTAAWKQMEVPGYWADQGLGLVNGVVWFRRSFDLPTSMAGKPATLDLGRIVDADSVFLNGMFAGTTSYQYPPRWYDIPPGVLRAGKNVVVVRVINSAGKGGFVPDKPYQLSSAGGTVDLRGPWLYRLGARMDPLGSQTFIRWKPLGLYNAMIAPLVKYTMTGVIWYQGESNATRALEYRRLFPALIDDWREKWGEGEFPFLYVQLPNFMEARGMPSESDWAVMRESQLKSLAVPHTAMAVTIDIGEWNDIHPLDKKDVGARLALAAEHAAYGDRKVVYSGPIFQSMTVQGNKAVLRFDQVGGGLTAKGGELKEFAIAGEDKRFVWARAEIQGDNTVAVWSDSVAHPTAVRYAWADNPQWANLYNKEGLPASPFRTDQ